MSYWLTSLSLIVGLSKNTYHHNPLENGWLTVFGRGVWWIYTQRMMLVPWGIIWSLEAFTLKLFGQSGGGACGKTNHKPRLIVCHRYRWAVSSPAHRTLNNLDCCSGLLPVQNTPASGFFSVAAAMWHRKLQSKHPAWLNQKDCQMKSPQ